MRKLLAAIPLLAILALPADLAAKNKQGKEHKSKGKNHSEWRYRTEPARGQWRHGASTHPPHDANGDGIVSRHEWPGNDVSFRRLDRNGDGVLSNRDRKLRGDRRYYNDYDYRR